MNMDTMMTGWYMYFDKIPNLLFALLVLLAGWLAAKGIGKAVEAALKKTRLDDKLFSNLGQRKYASEVIAGKIVYYLLLVFVWIIFFNMLNLSLIAAPLVQMLSTITAAIPNLLKAALILLFAWAAATLIQMLFKKGAAMVHLQRYLVKWKMAASELTAITKVNSMAKVLFYFVLLFFLPAVLGALQMKGILEPFVAMLNKMLSLIPNIAVAVLMVLVGLWLGKWVERIVTQMLWRVRLNDLFHRIGIGSGDPEQSKYNPSQIVGILAKIVVVLLFTVEALQIVHLAFLVTLATAVIAYLPMLFAALVILGIGLFLGHLVEGILKSVLKKGYSRTLASVAKYAIFTITIFMALDQLGVAHSIVNAAFILVLGGLALAFGLAFGLGGKDFAAKWLGKLDRKLEEEKL